MLSDQDVAPESVIPTAEEVRLARQAVTDAERAVRYLRLGLCDADARGEDTNAEAERFSALASVRSVELRELLMRDVTDILLSGDATRSGQTLEDVA